MVLPKDSALLPLIDQALNGLMTNGVLDDDLAPLARRRPGEAPDAQLTLAARIRSATLFQLQSSTAASRAAVAAPRARLRRRAEDAFSRSASAVALPFGKLARSPIPAG